jgi:hypothetical protein
MHMGHSRSNHGGQLLAAMISVNSIKAFGYFDNLSAFGTPQVLIFSMSGS